MTTARDRHLVVAFLAALSLVAAPTTTEAQDRGRCAVAEVHWDFALPDGSLFDGGRLKICSAGDYTPSAGLHTVHVDRRPVGMLMSKVRSAERAGDTRPELLFRRDLRGNLVLAGFVWPATTRTRSFELHSFGPGSADRMARVGATSEAGDLVRLAARFD